MRFAGLEKEIESGTERSNSGDDNGTTAGSTYKSDDEKPVMDCETASISALRRDGRCVGWQPRLLSS